MGRSGVAIGRRNSRRTIPSCASMRWHRRSVDQMRGTPECRLGLAGSVPATNREFDLRGHLGILDGRGHGPRLTIRDLAKKAAQDFS